MKVGHVTERQGLEGATSSVFDTDDMDRAGIELGATGRLQLMAKLAEGEWCKTIFYPRWQLIDMQTKCMDTFFKMKNNLKKKNYLSGAY